MSHDQIAILIVGGLAAFGVGAAIVANARASAAERRLGDVEHAVRALIQDAGKSETMARMIVPGDAPDWR